MSIIHTIIRTVDEEADFALSVALKAIQLYKESEKLNQKDNDLRLLDNLAQERFPDYFSTRYRMDKIKKAVDDGLVGSFDRDGNRVCSYSQLRKFLFNK